MSKRIKLEYRNSCDQRTLWKGSTTKCDSPESIANAIKDGKLICQQDNLFSFRITRNNKEIYYYENLHYLKHKTANLAY